MKTQTFPAHGYELIKYIGSFPHNILCSRFYDSEYNDKNFIHYKFGGGGGFKTPANGMKILKKEII